MPHERPLGTWGCLRPSQDTGSNGGIGSGYEMTFEEIKLAVEIIAPRVIETCEREATEHETLAHKARQQAQRAREMLWEIQEIQKMEEARLRT